MQEMSLTAGFLPLLTACITVAFLFGGTVYMTRNNKKRIEKVEEEQSETSKLLHDLNGKVDMIIDLVKRNGQRRND